jgi:hypothetical protein
MCNVYTPVTPDYLGKPNLKGLYGAYVAPLKQGPFLKAKDLTVGQWGMISQNSRSSKQCQTRNNCPSPNISRTMGGWPKVFDTCCVL